MHLVHSIAIRPNLELKTRSKQLLVALQLDIALPSIAHYSSAIFETFCLGQNDSKHSVINNTLVYWLGKIRQNGTAHFKKCKQLFEYQYLLLISDIWWSMFKPIFKYCSFFNTRVN